MAQDHAMSLAGTQGFFTEMATLSLAMSWHWPADRQTSPTEWKGIAWEPPNKVEARWLW